MNVSMVSRLIAELFTASEYLGKVDVTSLSQQTMMELVMENCQQANLFQDKEGYFLDVEIWSGISHNDAFEITAIRWTNIFKAPGHIHLEYLPPTVEDFYADFNDIAGSLDCSRLPSAIKLFSVPNNCLEGSIDLTALPEALNTLDLGDNLFTGSVDLTQLNASLVSLDLQLNKLEGTVDLSSLPGALEHLSLRGNQFSGSLDFSLLPASFRIGKFENNAFIGDSIVHPQSSNLMLINLTGNQVGKIINQDGSEEPINRIWL